MGYLPGQAVTEISTGKMWDFGYYGRDGYVIIYYHGERNMQDSIAIPEHKIRPATQEEINSNNWANYCN